MSKQLDFFPDAYLSDEAIKENSNAEENLENMLKLWENRKKSRHYITLKELFMTLKGILKFPITITQVNNFNPTSFMNSFLCTDNEKSEAEIQLISMTGTRALSLKVFIKKHQTKREVVYRDNFIIEEDKITKQVKDRTIIRYYDDRYPPTDFGGWSIKIITKDNLAFQIQLEDKDNETFFDKFELFCYDGIDTAEQLYTEIKKTFKINKCYIRVYKIIDSKEHHKSSYRVSGQWGIILKPGEVRRCVFGEYFEENNACIEARLMRSDATSIEINYYKDGNKILKCKFSYIEDSDPYIETKISLKTLGEIGDLGLIQKQIYDNYKRLCKKVIVGHRYQKYFELKLN